MAKREYRRNGTVRWLDDEGHAHRLDGPAVVWPDGTQFWYRHRRYHFAHGPSDLYAEGLVAWYEAGEYLRMRHPYG